MPSKKAVSEGNARRNKNKERKKKRKRSAEESDACFEKVKCFRRNSWKPGVYIYIFFLLGFTDWRVHTDVLFVNLLLALWHCSCSLHVFHFMSVVLFFFFFNQKKKCSDHVADPFFSLLALAITWLAPGWVFFFFLFRLLSPSFSFSFFTLLVNPESTFLFFLLFQIARCVLFWVFFFFSVSLRFRKLFSKLIYTDGGKNRNKKLRCSV